MGLVLRLTVRTSVGFLQSSFFDQDEERGHCKRMNVGDTKVGHMMVDIF
jgi:hypothetical protein